METFYLWSVARTPRNLADTFVPVEPSSIHHLLITTHFSGLFIIRNERKPINMAALKLRQTGANVTKTCSDNLELWLTDGFNHI